MKKFLLLSIGLVSAATMMAYETNYTSSNEEVATSTVNEISSYDSNTGKLTLQNNIVMRTETLDSLVVSYREPKGTYYCGFNNSGSYYGNLFGPANNQLTWINTTTGATEEELNASEWLTQNTGTTTVKDTKDLLRVYGPVSGPTKSYGSPKLTVRGVPFILPSFISDGTQKYYGIQTGIPTWRETDGVKVDYGMLPFNIAQRGTISYSKTNISNLDTCGVYWAKRFSATSAKVDGFCSIYDAPVTEYVIKQVRVSAYCQYEAGAQATVEIRAVDKNGFIGDVLASSTLTLDTAKTTLAAQYMTFPPIKVMDPVLGWEIDGLAVNSAIAVCITGINDKFTFFGPRVAIYPKDKIAQYGYKTSYIMLTLNEGTDAKTSGIVSTQVLNFSSGNPDGFLFMLDCEFPWIKDLSGDYSHVIDYQVPAEGGSTTYHFTGSAEPSNIVVYEEYDEVSASWCTESDKVTTYSGTECLEVSLTCEALPADVKGRTAQYIVSSDRATKTINVIQGDASSVTNAVADANGVSAYVADSDIVVSADKAGVAQVFTADGKLVKSVDVLEGTTVIDGSNLASGVYIVKVGKAAVKVVK